MKLTPLVKNTFAMITGGEVCNLGRLVVLFEKLPELYLQGEGIVRMWVVQPVYGVYQVYNAQYLYTISPVAIRDCHLCSLDPVEPIQLDEMREMHKDDLHEIIRRQQEAARKKRKG